MPSNVAGVHRARILSKYLPAHGWTPKIICVHERHHKEELDYSLNHFLPDSLDVVKTGALSTKMCRTFGIGDLGVRGYWAMKRAIFTCLDTERISVVLFTVLPGFPLLMIPELKRRFDVPVMVDFQDPWGASDASGVKFLSKRWFAQKLAVYTERRSLPYVDAICSVSEGTNNLIRQANGSLVRKDFSVVPIGCDPDDFRMPIDNSSVLSQAGNGNSVFRISYIGSVWPAAHQVVEAFIGALAIIKAHNPEIYQILEVGLFGTSCLPGVSERYAVLPLAKKMHVDDNFKEYPGRINYSEAVRLMKSSDLLLIFGSTEPHYTSSKLFPVLLSRKPVLAILNSESSTVEVSKRTGGVCLVTFSEQDPVAGKTKEIARNIVTLIKNPQVETADLNQLKMYTGDAIARKFVQIFQGVTR